jgi:hypothetical protein
MAVATRRGVPDRVPVMCQLALGHTFLHSGFDPVDVWHDGAEFAEALVRLQRAYGFDGILVNLPGRPADWRAEVDRVETVGRDRHVVWKGGLVTVCPPDDNPHVFLADRRTRPRLRLEDLEADRLFYLEPHGLSSAWAGGGLISTLHYREFVLPVEARAIAGFKARCPGTRTCARCGRRRGRRPRPARRGELFRRRRERRTARGTPGSAGPGPAASRSGR